MDEALYDPATDDLPEEASAYYRKLLDEEAAYLQQQELARDEWRFRVKRSRKLTPELARLARKTADAGRARLENAARTAEDFRQIVSVWDKADRNRERRELYHELPRGDLPLEYGRAYDGGIIPRFYMDPAIRQLSNGYFLDILFDCPYEMHELTADAILSQALFRLKEDHKEIFYFLTIRLYSAQEVAAMRGQTDRNIRKVRTTILKRLRKPVYEHLKRYGRLTPREREFIELYEATGGGKKGKHEDTV